MSAAINSTLESIEDGRSYPDGRLAGPIAALETERTVHAIADEDQVEETVNDGELTWGLAVVGADQSAGTGDGIRAAVLDTGFYLSHPDFVDRDVITGSFVTGKTDWYRMWSTSAERRAGLRRGRHGEHLCRKGLQRRGHGQ